jgi:hypothetical protein
VWLKQYNRALCKVKALSSNFSPTKKKKDPNMVIRMLFSLV